MGWKKKEEELAPDIAVERAHEEFDKYWLRSPALFLSVLAENGVPHVLQLHQLKIIPGTGTELTKRIPEIPEILKGIWVLVVVDPVDVRTKTVLETLKEWKDRYERLGVHFFVILRSQIPFYQTPEGLRAFDDDNKLEGVLATDHDLNLTKGFGAISPPCFQLWCGEKCVAKTLGATWNHGLEEKLQAEIRSADPGIPMFPIVPDEKIRKLKGRNEIVFGSRFKNSPLNRAPWKPVYHTITVDGEDVQEILHYEADFGEAGFKVTSKTKQKNGNLEKQGEENRKPGEVPPVVDETFPEMTIKGKWILKESGIFTEDSKAEISWTATYENVNLMACKASTLELPGRIALEINKRTPLAQFCSPEARIDDEGHLVLDLRRESFRSAFNKLGKRPGERAVSLKFTQASKIPVKLFVLVEWE